MRRFELMSAAATIALVTALPSAAFGADAAAGDRTTGARATGDAADIDALRLECRPRVADTGPVVHCDWSAPASPPAAAVLLYRSGPAIEDARSVVYRSGIMSDTDFVDDGVRMGQRYAYVVVAIDENGRIVARSRAEWVQVASDEVEALRLRCALGSEEEAIGCAWSRPQSRDAFVVALWRSVDGGPRELVHRFRPSGPHDYRDPVPPGASSVTYAVVATSEAGPVVAQSRPRTVRVPSIDVAPRRDHEELAAL
jgi:hypothetical protein